VVILFVLPNQITDQIKQARHRVVFVITYGSQHGIHQGHHAGVISFTVNGAQVSHGVKCLPSSLDSLDVELSMRCVHDETFASRRRLA